MTLADQKIAALRAEACEFFGISDDDLGSRIADDVGKETAFNWIGWAEWEWRYGWPEAVATKCEELKINTVLDFGAGVGEVGLYLAERGIGITLCDLPSEGAEFLEWRAARRLRGSLRVLHPNRALWPKGRVYDAVLCLEVLEHVPHAPTVLRRLLQICQVGLCLTGVNGRPVDDADALHVYKEDLWPVLQEASWVLHSGGGTPWWFLRREYAREHGLAILDPDGSEEGPGDVEKVDREDTQGSWRGPVSTSAAVDEQLEAG